MAKLVTSASTVVSAGIPLTKYWPNLRDDLTLLAGPRSYEGSPTWTLYDPARHKYYRIGWLEFECLQRWYLEDNEAITNAIHAETPMAIDKDDLQQFTEFLIRHELVKPMGMEFSKRYAHSSASTRGKFWIWLLHNYLFLRIPLLKPDRYLRKILPWLGFFFHRYYLVGLFITVAVAFYLIAEQWSLFINSFLYNLTPEGLIATVGMLSLSKVIHELGHALTASHFGCRVPAMGVAFLLGMPVLWTDVTDAWRLSNRYQRLLIDAAGVLAELSLAVVATLVWTLLPDGAFRSGVYLLASSAWIITLAININPFMRFDGYYLLADYLDIPNLQDRSFAVAKWQLRESLFGFGLEPPEHWPKARKRLVVIYAYLVWIYRLVLFTGIAWAVYYFFFKALGLFLFAVEIGWFIVRPIVKEMIVWRQLLAQYGWPKQFRPAWLVLLAGILVLFIPWQSHLLVPGLLRAEAEYTFYAIDAAQVKQVHVKEGETVKTDQLIAQLQSPDLDYKIVAAKLSLQELTERLGAQSLQIDLARHNPKDFEELQSVKAELQGLQQAKEKLAVRATFSGIIRDLSEALRPGEWLAKDEPLGIVQKSLPTVIAYVEEADLPHLQIGGQGRFYPEGGDFRVVPVSIIAIDKTGTRELKLDELASTNGGEIAVRTDKDKRLIPEQGIYRIALQADLADLSPANTIRGRLSLATVPESIASRLIRLLTVAVVKESGW